MYAFMPIIGAAAPPDGGSDPEETWLQYLQGQGIEFGLNLITALVIFFVGKWAARIATRLVDRLMERAGAPHISEQSVPALTVRIADRTFEGVPFRVSPL